VELFVLVAVLAAVLFFVLPAVRERAKARFQRAQQMIDDMLQQQSSYMEDQPLSDAGFSDWHAGLCIRYNFAQVRMHKSRGNGRNYGVF
jgi:type II secretory pathway pseudopilin PulG